MLQLIERLRALVEAEQAAVGPDMYTRGMLDVLLAMEERVGTVRTVTQPIGVSSQGAVDRLWERA